MAQIQRFELGQRVARFERAWQAAVPENRAASVAAMNAAVRSFFGLDPKQTAAHVDQAFMLVQAIEPADELLRYGLSRRLAVRDLLADTSHRQLQIKVTKFYDPQVPGPDAATLRLSVQRPNGQLVDETTCDLDAAASGFTWRLETDEGDYLLRAKIQHHEAAVPMEPVTFSRVAGLDSRLQALDRTPGDATPALDETCAATIRSSLKLLKSLHAGSVPECNLPASRMLRFCEQLRDPAADPQALVAASAAISDLWMALCKDGKEVAVRLRAPAADSRSDRLPVLFLLHGAGGSENMFFENYGAGRAVQLAIERGWLVIAPRQGFLGLPLNHVEQLEVLEHFFSIDRQRVFLLGHSMGAAQVVRQVSINPGRECVCAAAAIGGGGQPSKAPGMEFVPWFIAAGKQDFGRPLASALAARLKSLGAEVTYREYDDVEHLVIVQASLDDAFRFFDQAAGKR